MRIDGVVSQLAFRGFLMLCTSPSRGLDGIGGYLVQSYGISTDVGTIVYYWKGNKGGYYSHVNLKKHYG